MSGSEPKEQEMLIEYKSLSLQGQVIFEKMILGQFTREVKPFSEREACFMYIQEGACQFRTPEKVIQLSTGQGMLAKCGNYFLEQTKEDHQNYSRSKGVGAYLYPTMIKELFDFDLTLSDFETAYDATPVNIDALMQNFIQGIDFLLDNPSVATDAMLKVKLKEFLLLLSKTENAPSILDFVASLFKPREYDFKKIIDQNLFTSLSVNEFATLCGMSISTFQRKFHEVFGQTPAKYIMQERLQKAKELLTNKNLRISEIAYDCGYQSTSTFNRVFKNQFGYSPSHFRLNEIE